MKKVVPEFDYFMEAPWIRQHRRYTHYIKYFQLKLNKKSFSLLDAGSGTGELVAQSLDSGVKAVGIDISRPTLLRSQPKQRGFLINSDAHFLPFRDSTFDVICAFDLVEHLVDLLQEPFRFQPEDELQQTLSPRRQFIW